MSIRINELKITLTTIRPIITIIAIAIATAIIIVIAIYA